MSMFKIVGALGALVIGSAVGAAFASGKTKEPTRTIPVVDGSIEMMRRELLFGAIEAASTNPVVYTDIHYRTAPKYVQDFIYWHEVGHFTLRHTSQYRRLSDEFAADLFAANIIGKNKARAALLYMFTSLCNTIPSAIADFPSRFKELGGSSAMLIVYGADGKRIQEPELRRIILENEEIERAKFENKKMAS